MTKRGYLAVLSVGLMVGLARAESPVVLSEFIYETAPFPSCHASTLVESAEGGGLVAAWFGGTHERNPDVGIWVSRRDAKGWSEPVEVANGVQAEGPRLPTWNPVLFRPKGGPLMLFYKVGPSPSKWWGMVMRSADDGRTWSKPTKLPAGIIGPVKDKAIQLEDGTILSPSSTEDAGWRLHMEWSKDGGATWERTEALNDGKEVRLIQPAVLDWGGGKIQALCRSRHEKVYELWSGDNGRTWDKPAATSLPNPSSGIDAVRLADGRALVVYNHSATKRIPLNVAVSRDGKEWGPPVVVEDLPDGEGQLSYPAAIQTSDGLVHLTYTWSRKKIRHVVLDPKLIP